jgi:hypothetical protein
VTLVEYFSAHGSESFDIILVWQHGLRRRKGVLFFMESRMLDHHQLSFSLFAAGSIAGVDLWNKVTSRYGRTIFDHHPLVFCFPQLGVLPARILQMKVKAKHNV